VSTPLNDEQAFFPFSHEGPEGELEGNTLPSPLSPPERGLIFFSTARGEEGSFSLSGLDAAKMLHLSSHKRGKLLLEASIVAFLDGFVGFLFLTLLFFFRGYRPFSEGLFFPSGGRPPPSVNDKKFFLSSFGGYFLFRTTLPSGTALAPPRFCRRRSFFFFFFS